VPALVIPNLQKFLATGSGLAFAGQPCLGAKLIQNIVVLPTNQKSVLSAIKSKYQALDFSVIT
jgi:hypothetical protein